MKESKTVAKKWELFAEKLKRKNGSSIMQMLGNARQEKEKALKKKMQCHLWRPVISRFSDNFVKAYWPVSV